MSRHQSSGKFLVKQYAWVQNMRMHNLPLKSFDFCIIRAGVTVYFIHYTILFYTIAV